MVTEKLEIDNSKFWINKESQLNIEIRFQDGNASSFALSRDETIDLLNGLERQLSKVELDKPFFTWPWKTEK